MVEAQIVRRGITAEPVLAAMRKVPRHDFVPEDAKDHAYEGMAFVDWCLSKKLARSCVPMTRE